MIIPITMDRAGSNSQLKLNLSAITGLNVDTVRKFFFWNRSLNEAVVYLGYWIRTSLCWWQLMPVLFYSPVENFCRGGNFNSVIEKGTIKGKLHGTKKGS